MHVNLEIWKLLERSGLLKTDVSLLKRSSSFKVWLNFCESHYISQANNI